MSNQFTKKSLIIFVSFFLWTTFLTAQVPQISNNQIQEELNKKGLEEDIIRKKLLERGIDIDNLDSSNPQEVQRLQIALEEVTREIEQEKKESLEETPKEVEETIIVEELAAETSEEIIDAVEDGATIEEAISEEIIDAQENQLPPAVVFGQHIFRNKEIGSYSNSNAVRADNSYILDVGDKIAVSIWGPSELDIVLEINKDGYIKPPQMSRINLKGITLGKAKDLLRKRFSNYYKFGANQFEISVTYPRTISVNIVGEVLNSGSFTMPAINTAFNAIAAADGPSNIGSVRNITLIRPGGITKKLDIYKYLLDPSIAQDYYLQDNDYIHIGVADRVISIVGAIKRPFQYELLSNENLKDLIKYAGGFQSDAYQTNIKIKRFVNDQEKIIDINYRNTIQKGEDFILQGGDEVVVGVIPKPYKNYVEIIGEVDIPGKYELDNGMKIKDLLQKGKLSDFAKTDLAYLLRTNSNGTLSYLKLNLDTPTINNFPLQAKDQLVIYSKQRFQDTYEISVEGAVRFPSKYEYDPNENLKIEDLILLAGGLRKDATSFAYIHRIDPSNVKKEEYIRIDVKNIMKNPNSADNFILKPNDRINIFSKIKFEDDLYVNVIGAVRNPGSYRFDQSLHLKDALTLSGGLKLTASKNKIDIFRMVLDEDKEKVSKTIVATVKVDEDMNLTSDSNFKLEPFDEIVVRDLPGFKLQRYITIEGEVIYPGPYALLNDNERISSIISRSGGITTEAFPEGATLYRENGGVGYVVLRLDKVLKNKDDKHNFILKKGDIIRIPEQKDLVSITGATRASELYAEKILQAGKFNVAFHPNKRAKWYIDEYAAGVGKKGRKRLITVEHPNGKIERTKDFLVFKIHPKIRKGSIIKVGEKPKKLNSDGERVARKDIDWGKVLADSVAQATAVLSLILLLERLN